MEKWESCFAHNCQWRTCVRCKVTQKEKGRYPAATFCCWPWPGVRALWTLCITFSSPRNFLSRERERDRKKREIHKSLWSFKQVESPLWDGAPTFLYIPSFYVRNPKLFESIYIYWRETVHQLEVFSFYYIKSVDDKKERGVLGRYGDDETFFFPGGSLSCGRTTAGWKGDQVGRIVARHER